jgi:hypothetical protein
MAMFAYGPKQLRSLELNLEEKLPKDAAKRPRAELERYFKERLLQRKTRRGEVNRLLAQARAPLMDFLKKDKRTNASAQALHKLLKHRATKLYAMRRNTKSAIDPRLLVASGLAVKVPPYDFPESNSSGSAQVFADEKTGQYQFNLTPDNSDAAAYAGIGVYFFATEDNPSQRFGVLLDYDYAWEDMSQVDTAHNDASTNIWVWGYTEKRWVYKNSDALSPSWSDGTSWYEEHGSGGDGSLQSGRESFEVLFPAFAKSVYAVLVWSQGSCDNGVFSESSQLQHMSIPLMVLGG